MSFIDVLIAIIYGIVEGITEWLPISSTGHMILLDSFLTLNVSEAFHELYLVVIQLGAIMAVVVIYWKEIWPFGIKDNKHPWKKEGIGRWVKADKFTMWFKILVACIPAVIVGVLFDDYLDELFYNYICVSIMLILFGIGFIVVEKWVEDKEPYVKSVDDITYPQALLIGAFQLIAAVFPGTSRSGSTIVGSLAMGISREAAAKFTFFLAIPVMMGASLLKILKYEGDVSGTEIATLVIGMVVAFVVSWVVIKKFMAFIKKHNFTVFGWYRIVIGILFLILGILGLVTMS
ncbi:MAG: undecaprenyl-diphosphate phosphatase [Clostridiales bacterium]|nr:undecaprenyl-diphosphate phosphatase [Clostridiales bacterium]